MEEEIKVTQRRGGYSGKFWVYILHWELKTRAKKVGSSTKSGLNEVDGATMVSLFGMRQLSKGLFFPSLSTQQTTQLHLGRYENIDR